MAESRIYLDNHSTTRVDPAVIDVMLPYFSEQYGNPGSTHLFGEEARAAIDRSRETIARLLNCSGSEIVFTSGATESNNLAIRGIVEKHSNRGNHIVSVATEHPAVLDPIERLRHAKRIEASIVPVHETGAASSGVLDLDRLQDTIRDDTILVSIMLANNEIGIVHPIADIAQLCHERGVLLHCDAAQAVGRIDVDVRQLDIDLMSFSAHKIYGPRGVGALYVRRRPRVKLEAQIDGGGQQMGRRSGTMNTPGIVGFAKAMEIATEQLEAETKRLLSLRKQLWNRLSTDIPGVSLNGPDLGQTAIPRLPGNLNVRFDGVDAESLMLHARGVAVSTGSACTAEKPEPSHVLLALGYSEDEARSSIRFGIGRFNTVDEIAEAAEQIGEAVKTLRAFGTSSSS